MAKKKSKKIKMVESHEAQTIGFLQRSGIPAKDIKKLIHEIHELIEFGGVSIPEAHQEVLENWHQRTALAGLRELEADLKKQTADVAKAQKRALAAAKATTKANEAAARLAAKPAAEPAGPTVMPRPESPEQPRPESGIRKALGKSLTKEEQEYQKTLDKLRSDAANTVQENPDLFGSGRYDQTIDQSTLYQLYEGVVELGESAAKARKAEDKQRLLASLNAYKKIVMSLAKEGSDKEKELANKLLEIIASIEKKLSKGSGEIGRLKENLKDWAQRLPENLAAKIPLVGGFISGMLQRKRERKEGEEYQKQDILAASSRGIGSSSLFGKVGGDRGGMGGMSESAIEGISTGGSDLGDIESAETSSPLPSGSLGGGETIRTLQSILVQVTDIKSLIQGQTDPEAGLDTEEATRETADKENDFLNKFKGLLGGGKGGKGGGGAGGAGGAGSGGGVMGVVEDMVGGGIVATSLKWIATQALPVVVAAAGGLAIGTGVAYGVNKLIDLAVGNAPGDGLADYQFRAETYGFGAKVEKQRELEMQSNAAAANQAKANTPENKKKRAMDASVDPRSLSASVLSGAMTPKEASDALDAYQQLNPDDENISQYRKDINVAYTKTTKMAAGSTVQQRKLKTKSEALETETQYAGDIVLGEKETILDASKQKTQKTVVGGVRDPATGLFKYGGEPKDLREQLTSMGYIKHGSSGKSFDEAAKLEAAAWKAEQLESNGSISAPSTSNTAVGAATAQLDKSREGLQDAQFVGPMQPGSNSSNTVIAPKTNNTTINNNAGGASTRNNDPTLKSAERGSM